VTCQKGLPAAGPQGKRCLFLFGPGRLHHGNQFAGNEWERYENRSEDNPWNRKNDFYVVFIEFRAEKAVQSK